MDGVDIKKEGKAEVVWKADYWGSCRLEACLFLVHLQRRWPGSDLFYSLYCCEGEEEAFHLATDAYKGDAKLEKEIGRWNIRLNLYKEGE